MDELLRQINLVVDREAAHEEAVSKDAYIANAQFHLDWVRMTINDALIGRNDGELKRSLLQDLDAADLNLRKALS